MIRYDLACSAGHAFDGWFRDSTAFDDQAARGLLGCPVCGSADVAKQIMAPALARTDVARPGEPVEESRAGPPAPTPPAPVALLTERDRAFRDLLRAVRRHVLDTAENVGRDFADEARRMHEGLSDFRAIYGEATLEEARMLHEEGIEALPLPVVPDERN